MSAAGIVARRRRRPPLEGPEVINVADLPSYAFSHRSVMWWGTLGMIAIEGTVFALMLMTYFYLRTRVIQWPPALDPPRLVWGTLNIVLLLASAIPNQLAKKAAEKRDLAGCRLWTWVMVGIGVVLMIVRGLEFTTLNCRWDSNAYGSVVWTLLGLHTVHLVTDIFDTVVLAVLLVTGPLEGKRFGDVAENALYWYFVVIAWIPIYAVIYLAPRMT